MTRKDEEVAAQPFDVDCEMRRRLRAVDQHPCIHASRATDDFVDRIDQPKHIRHMTHGHEPRSRGEGAFEVFEIELPIVVHAEDANRGARPLCNRAPGQPVRVVFGH